MTRCRRDNLQYNPVLVGVALGSGISRCNVGQVAVTVQGAREGSTSAGRVLDAKQSTLLWGIAPSKICACLSSRELKTNLNLRKGMSFRAKV